MHNAGYRCFNGEELTTCRCPRAGEWEGNEACVWRGFSPKAACLMAWKKARSTLKCPITCGSNPVPYLAVLLLTSRFSVGEGGIS